jgi:hypothetical protein
MRSCCFIRQIHSAFQTPQGTRIGPSRRFFENGRAVFLDVFQYEAAHPRQHFHS